MQKDFLRMRSFLEMIERHPATTGFLLCIISAAFFLWLQWSPHFPDPDSFYHLKIAELMSKTDAFVTEFPWLPLTILPDIFTDQAWLYHLFLIPFTYFTDPLVGLKVATVILDVVLIMLIYWMLRKWNVKYAWIYIFLLLLTNPFIFRISLAKTPAISVLIMMLGLYFLFSSPTKKNGNKFFERGLSESAPIESGLLGSRLNQSDTTFRGRRVPQQKNMLPLFFISLLFVWTHAAWPLLIIACAIYWTVSSYFDMVGHFKNNHGINGPKDFFKILFKSMMHSQTKFALLAAIAGSVVGLVINPYFPKTFSFFWTQTILISVWNFKDKIEVGSEWYGFDPSELIGSAVFIAIAALIAVTIFFTRLKCQTRTSWTLLLLTSCLFFLTLKSRRNSEYLIPVAVFFTAWVFSHTPREAWNELRALAHRAVKKNMLRIITVYLSLALLYIAGRDITRIRSLLHEGFTGNTLAGTCEWIKSHGVKNEIIAHSEWEHFPLLFRCAPEFRYLIGLDPTFLYLASPKTYTYFRELQENKATPSAYEFENQFSSSLFIVSKKRQPLINTLSQDLRWHIEYTDGEIVIFSTPSRINLRKKVLAYSFYQ